jgi:hypothetical protein
MHFSRDKKKELAPNYAAYYPFGVDVYLSPQKLNHISRFVQLPDVQLSSKLPPLLVVNVQVSHKYTRTKHCLMVKVLYIALLFIDFLITRQRYEAFVCLFMPLIFFSLVLNLSNCYTYRHMSVSGEMNCMSACFKYIQTYTCCS